MSRGGALFIFLAGQEILVLGTLIGTRGTGHTFPGAVYPFGAVQLSPDCGLDGWNYSAGYQHGERIARVSHTHLSGTGVGDGQDIAYFFRPFLPVEEVSEPGYYRAEGGGRHGSVILELTASEFCGMTRFRGFGAVTMDLTSAFNHDTYWDSERSMSHVEGVAWGFRSSRGWGTHTVFFAAAEQRSLNAGGPGENLVCISQHSRENALEYLQAHRAAGLSFDTTRAAADAAWAVALSPLSLGPGASAAERAMYQAALYHTLIHPSLTDLPPLYPDTPPFERRYSVFSTWDTHRAWSPLMTLLHPQRIPDWTASLLAHGPTLPVWELWGSDTVCMSGTHSVSLLAEWLAKGLVAPTVEQRVWAAVRTTLLTRSDRHYHEYYSLGFVPVDASDASASFTLEHAYTDAALGRAFEVAGLPPVQRHANAQHSWRRLWNEERGLLLAAQREGGHDENGADRVNGGFEEGSALGHLFAVRHDFRGLVGLFGAAPEVLDACSMDRPCEQRVPEFKAALDAWFAGGHWRLWIDVGGADGTGFTKTAPASPCGQLSDLSHCIGQYVHSNEPAQHAPYLYSVAGYPEETCRVVRDIVRRFYSAEPDGLPGNDDAGALSAWLLFAGLGLFPVNPASGVYVLGCPVAGNMTLGGIRSRMVFSAGLEPGSAGPSAGGRLLRYWWNGVRLRRVFLEHAELVAGGELVVEEYDGSSSSAGDDDAPPPLSGRDLGG